MMVILRGVAPGHLRHAGEENLKVFRRDFGGKFAEEKFRIGVGDFDVLRGSYRDVCHGPFASLPAVKAVHASIFLDIIAESWI
jgi:hypothetical protein